VKTKLRDKIRHAVLGIGTVRMAERKQRQGKRMFRSIKHHALVGTRGPSGRGAAGGAEGLLLIEAVSAAGHRSLGGKGGGCDIDIVRDFRTGDGDAGVLERYDGTAGVADL
jgi:hypothetical protein